MIDIIFFIILTIFLLKKINIVIGTKGVDEFFQEHSIKDISLLNENKKTTEKKSDRDVFLKNLDINIFNNNITESFKHNSKNIENLKKIYLSDKQFDLKNFTTKFKTLINLILDRYSEQDLEALSSLVSESFMQKLRSKFNDSVNEIIIPVKIKNILIDEIIDQNSISFYIEMDQIIYSIDKNENLVEGSKTVSHEINEFWKIIKFNNIWLLDGIKDSHI